MLGTGVTFCWCVTANAGAWGPAPTVGETCWGLFSCETHPRRDEGLETRGGTDRFAAGWPHGKEARVRLSLFPGSPSPKMIFLASCRLNSETVPASTNRQTFLSLGFGKC